MIRGDWLLALTILVTTFLFYAKTFKLEVYRQDLKEKTAVDSALLAEIEGSIERWQRLTFLKELRNKTARKK